MSGTFKRGLTFNVNVNGNKNANSSAQSKQRNKTSRMFPETPEISVISLDMRRYSEDLKKDAECVVGNGSLNFIESPDLSQDPDSDEISNFIGHYGRWQFVWTMILSLFQVPATFHIFVFVFQSLEKKFWCDMPNGTGNLYENITNVCLMPGPGNETQNCKEFKFFDDGRGTKTIIEDFNLVCERRYLLSLAEMCFLLGAAIGSVSSGYISDRYGRKPTLLISLLVQTILGTILAFVPSLALYMLLRFIIGFASITIAVVSFVLVVELVSGKWRTIIGILNILPMSLTYVLTAGIAFQFPNWRSLELAISLPCMILLFIWYCVPESPRWLLATGRLPELFSVIERAARFNRLELPEHYRKTLTAAATMNSTSEQPQQKQNETELNAGTTLEMESTTKTPESTTTTSTTTPNPLIVVFNRTYWLTTVLNFIVWLTMLLLYYGLTLHLSNLGGNVYLNTLLVGSLESISVVSSVFIVLKGGICRTLIVFMLIPGICCLGANFVPAGDNNSFIVIILAIIAKCVIGANNAIIPTFTAAQYPTEIRNFGVGMGNFAAGIALILVPYLWLLENVNPVLPLTVMGAGGLIGAVGLFFMRNS